MKLLAVDGNSILNRAFYGIKLLTTKDGTYTNAVYGFMNILLKVCDDIKPDGAAVAFDLHAPTFRHKMFDGYKAGRKGMPDELRAQVPLIKELLTSLGYSIVEKEGYEADDILGTLAKACEKSGDECAIVTGDRDSLQLISDKTTVRLAATKMGRPETVIYDVDKIKEVYGVTPGQMIDIKALMGDASDNIPGVAGIGEKTALTLIQAYHDIDSLYKSLDTAADIKDGVKAKLKAGEESARMSYTLATICCEVPIETSPAAYTKAGGDPSHAAALMNRLELFSLLKRLNLTAVPTVLPKAEEKPAGVKILLDPTAEDIGTLIQAANPLCFLCRFEGDELTALYLYADGTIAATDRAGQYFEAFVRTVFESDVQKVTHDVKPVYHWAFEHTIELKNVVCDLALAAYLINPLASSYELDRLCAEYAVTPFDTPFLPDLVGIASVYGLYKKLWAKIDEYAQVNLLCNIEIPLAKVLASMESIGFHVDIKGITDFGRALDVDIARLAEDIYSLAGGAFNINSPKQLGEVLFVRLALPSGKKTKSGFSTSAEVLEELRGKHEIVDNILEYRKLTKLKSTYVEGLLRQARADGTVHTSFNQTETRTGRISSTEPNLQNIPVRTKLGSEMRKFFVAGEGCTLIDADYSQIELRVLAHMSNDENMINAFVAGIDIHTQTAAQVFGMPEDMVTPLMRSRAKAVNFGIVYGIGAFSLSQDINVSVSEADKYIKSYLSTYSGVRAYMEDAIEFGREHGYAKTMFNRRRSLPEITAANRNIKAFGERVAMNTPIQGTAADIIKIAMVKVFERLKREGLQSRLILQIHDELIVEAPLNEAQAAARILQEEMENAVKLRVPLLVDAHTGANWYAAKG
ncbi:DNA polymerase I [Acetanaerobacterium elongatum]|uniref:DNA polymerase I n=1 Tax=Acetanaerobacterium elongatum TaxID=258515 RepID=A0A1G9V728_9FIRM|nr:DNA polymerase I [Acetanaerobacterium elongatum]SDM67961.1 DNA polymerase I [Acetanaerobacterium elongatum]